MKLDASSFERINAGNKVVEVRLFDEKRKNIKIGDSITFLKLPDIKESVKTVVTGISTFKSFNDLFSVFGPEYFGRPESMSVEDFILGMREVYSEEDEKKFGVIGIHIVLA